jgi:DUF4097 and DUF4098 domain-containing protein YvlB
LDSLDVRIVPSDREDIYISHTYTDKEDFEIVHDEGANLLTITQEIEVFNFFNFREIASWFMSPDELIIEVPNTIEFDTLDLSLMNGELDVSELSIDSLNIDVANGKVVLEELILSDLMEVEVINGTIYLYDTISTNTADLTTVNGSLVVKNVAFNQYILRTENGKIDLLDLNSDLYDGVRLNAKTTNGGIDLENVYVADVSLETTNGSIEYDNEDTSFILDDLDVNTVNGSYVGNVSD